MTEFRTIATFRSARFLPPEDGLLTASDALVQLVATALRDAGGYQVHEPEDEDWGAFVRVELGRAEYQLNFAPGDGPEADWMVEVQDPPGLLTRILSAEDPAAHKRLVRQVHSILSAEPSIAGLRWHLGGAIGNGDLSTGTAAPDP